MISINNNLAALGSLVNLNRVQLQLSNTYLQLSTGQRINRASDDAASLAISENLRVDIRSLQQAQRNASDGVSLAGVAESALGSEQEILGRLRELALESSTGTVSNEQRALIQNEFDLLRDELTRISDTTEFNGISLINGDIQNGIEIQVDSTAGTSVSLRLEDTDAAALGIEQLDVGSKSGAQAALAEIDRALGDVSTARASVGSFQNRLESAISNLQSREVNLTQAYSTIRDADFAQLVADQARGGILQSATIAVLGQASIQHQAVIRLLQF